MKNFTGTNRKNSCESREAIEMIKPDKIIKLQTTTSHMSVFLKAKKGIDQVALFCNKIDHQENNHRLKVLSAQKICITLSSRCFVGTAPLQAELQSIFCIDLAKRNLIKSSTYMNVYHIKL